ncbi:hypothetical protein BHM03_00057037 [Ensete ventricosum]|nr:hypothetical protein BHM03_00057037 [Ensete ventricosum]
MPIAKPLLMPAPFSLSAPKSRALRYTAPAGAADYRLPARTNRQQGSACMGGTRRGAARGSGVGRRGGDTVRVWEEG